MSAFIHFKKPIVVAINGPALGLGASILPLCDVVWASEKAWFQTPCAALHLTPSGCSSYMFPQILGVALVGINDAISAPSTLNWLHRCFVPTGRPTRCCSVEGNSRRRKRAVEAWCHKSSGPPHLTRK